MNCRECHDFIDAYIDNELDVATVILVEQHLRVCSQCQQLLESRKVVGALLSNPQIQFEVPDSLLGKDSVRHSGFRIQCEGPIGRKVDHPLVLCSISLGGGGRCRAGAGFALSRDKT